MELNKQEIFMLMKSLDQSLEIFDDDDDEAIIQAIKLKEKLKNAFEQLAKVD